MELQTISQVSKTYGVTTRMLRYYEQIGIIQSQRKEDYSYRVYDDENLKRLQQIIILRKLQIPVKQIGVILENPDATTAVDIFKSNIADIQAEITALSTIKSALEILLAKIEEIAAVRPNLLTDDSVLKFAESLSLIQKNVKEKTNMLELDKANTQLNKGANVRVIHIPPMTVASCYVRGDDCESKAREAIYQFAKESGLLNIKPDARCFAIGCDDEDLGDGGHHWRYEYCVSIPDDMNIPAPLEKKTFSGGVYAAYPAKHSNWDASWDVLMQWLDASDEYVNDCTARFTPHSPGIYLGGMEEALNFYTDVHTLKLKKKEIQYDLLTSLSKKD